MKNPLTLLFIIALPIFAMSQKLGKFFYNNQWELTTRESATYVRMCVYDTVRHFFAGPVTDMYLSGRPQMKGEYKLAKKEGEFTSYYEDGTIESSGRFAGDRREGVWRFNHANGKLRLEVEFAPWGSAKILSLYDDSGVQKISNGNGSWYEAYEEYNVPGKIIVTGELKNFEKHGSWTCRLSSGEMIYTEEYKDGEFVKGFTYHAGEKTNNSMPHGNQVIVPYKFVVTEGFGASADVDFTPYPFLAVLRRDSKSYYNLKKTIYPDSLRKDGTVEELYTLVDEVAKPPKGMAEFYRFIGNEMKYPVAARKAGVQGKVFVEFVIGKDGSMTEFAIAKSDNPLLDAEAVRTFKAYAAKHKWRPGFQRGKPVRQRMVMPMTFKLG